MTDVLFFAVLVLTGINAVLVACSVKLYSEAVKTFLLMKMGKRDE